MNELVNALQTHYSQKNCVYCGNEIDSTVTDETTFNAESHEGIYKNNPQEWYPHYDVEYLCKECDYYEYYTHDGDGNLLAIRINKVLFDLTGNEFAIIEGDQITPAGKLPEGVEYGSPTYEKYLDKVLKKAYSEPHN